MSLHLLPELTASRRRRSFAILRNLALAVGIAGVVVYEAAAAPPAASTPPTQPVVSDVVLAQAALTAIDADPELKKVNVLVSVVDRVAVIGGPVASARQSQRVEQLVRAVPGIVDVRNTCFVSLGPDPLLHSVAEKLGSSLPPRPTFVELPGVLTPELTLSLPNSPTAPTTPDASNTVAAAPTTVIALKPSGESAVLGAPVRPGETTTGSVSAFSPVTSTAPGVLTGTAPPMPAKPANVLTTANDMKKTDSRFAKLTVELRDGMLVVGGAAPQASDAWDFAKKLRLLPGVSRVVVGAVSVK
jgi:hypothetical protein